MDRTLRTRSMEPAEARELRPGMRPTPTSPPLLAAHGPSKDGRPAPVRGWSSLRQGLLRGEHEAKLRAGRVIAFALAHRAPEMAGAPAGAGIPPDSDGAAPPPAFRDAAAAILAALIRMIRQGSLRTARAFVRELEQRVDEAARSRNGRRRAAGTPGLLERLRSVLPRLPRLHARVIQAIYLESRPSDEVAAELDLTPAQLRWIQVSARHKLREQLIGSHEANSMGRRRDVSEDFGPDGPGGLRAPGATEAPGRFR